MLRRIVTVAKPISQKGIMSMSTTPIVNSHNEFDPLEEVIVGRVEGATIPEWHVSGKAVWPDKWWDMYKTKAGQPFPKELIQKGSFLLRFLS
jgi:glycine amidinotransferase